MIVLFLEKHIMFVSFRLPYAYRNDSNNMSKYQKLLYWPAIHHMTTVIVSFTNDSDNWTTCRDIIGTHLPSASSSLAISASQHRTRIQFHHSIILVLLTAQLRLLHYFISPPSQYLEFFSQLFSILWQRPLWKHRQSKQISKLGNISIYETVMLNDVCGSW